MNLDDVRAGDDLRPMVQVTTIVQQAQYSGAVQGFSAIHYDVEYAIERGFPTVIVHGFLKASFLTELALKWGGPGSWFKRFSVRYLGTDIVGDPIICRGTVKEVSADGKGVVLRLWTETVAGKVSTEAEGLLMLNDAALSAGGSKNDGTAA